MPPTTSSGVSIGVLAARKAVEDFDAGKPVTADAKDKGALALQKAFVAQLPVQITAADARVRKARMERITALRELVKALTKQGRIEDAVGVNAQIEGAEFFGTKWSFRNSDKEITVCTMLAGGKVESSVHTDATWSPIDSNSLRYNYWPGGDHIVFRYDDDTKKRMSGRTPTSRKLRFLYPLPR